jgi:hypothetical protein
MDVLMKVALIANRATELKGKELNDQADHMDKLLTERKEKDKIQEKLATIRTKDNISEADISSLKNDMAGAGMDTKAVDNLLNDSGAWQTQTTFQYGKLPDQGELEKGETVQEFNLGFFGGSGEGEEKLYLDTKRTGMTTKGDSDAAKRADKDFDAIGVTVKNSIDESTADQQKEQFVMQMTTGEMTNDEQLRGNMVKMCFDQRRDLAKLWYSNG